MINLTLIIYQRLYCMRNTMKKMAMLAALGMAIAGAGSMAETDVPQATEAHVAEQSTGAAQAAETAVEGETDQSGEEAVLAKQQLVEAQQMLIELGYLYGAADGLYGPMTASALIRFQAANGLEQTGELNDATMQALTRVVESVGDAKALQQRLIDLGYLRGGADGAFGEKSQAALKQFQAIHGLEATGMPDDATREVLFSERAKTLPKRLSGGSKGDEVVALQEKLIQYGFLSGEADGAYGMGTMAAVKRFQKHLQDQGKAGDLGIEPTGEATPVTLLMLYDPDYSTYVADISAGETGDEVARVERRLSALGYMDAVPDDTFDDYAVAAAEAFRADAGIGGSAYDRAFVDALFNTNAPIATHFVLHTIATGDQGVAVREAQEALVRVGMTVSMPDGVYGPAMAKGIEQLRDYLLSIGSTRVFLFEDPDTLTVEAQQLLCGDLLSDFTGIFNASDTFMVTRVQRRLHTLYFLSRTGVDGDFGERTRVALRDFQAANGLPDTGLADTATLNRLFSTDAACKKFPYRVEVSIDRQRVYVYELQDSGEYELVQTFICSTGMGNSTPRGIFLDGGPANVWHHFSKFDVWARYSFEIEGDIMFHSVLYSEKNTDSLREGSLYALGQKASHGCVRLAVKSARWLFEHCRKGSLVIIIY